MKLLAETIGVDKILFGSDWPHGEGLADPMAFTADIPQFPEFSAEDTRKVMRDNALDLLGVNGALGHACMGEWAIGAVLDAIADVVPDRHDDGVRRPPQHVRRVGGPTRRLANFLAGKGLGAHRERDSWSAGNAGRTGSR